MKLLADSRFWDTVIPLLIILLRLLFPPDEDSSSEKNDDWLSKMGEEAYERRRRDWLLR